MARLKIIVRADSPLSLGSVKGYGGTVIEGGQYIAGAHLRGALGAIRNYASEAETKLIDQLLGTAETTGINFPNCYPKGKLANSFPIPVTAQSCKKASGFASEKTVGPPHHGVFDTFLVQLAYDSVSGTENERRIPLPFRYACPLCGGRTEPFAGKMIEAQGNKLYESVNVITHRQTRVAINRARQTAEDGLLYSVQAIDEGTSFVGILEVSDELQDQATELLPQIRRIGGRTSRGFGLVKVSVEAAPSATNVEERIKVFNQKYAEVENDLRAIAINPPAPESRTLFTINLRSDALLRSVEGLQTLKLDAAMLRRAFEEQLREGELFDLDSFELELVAQFTQAHRVSGWQTIWKLPKEVLLSSGKGGIYVFAAKTEGDKAQADWLYKLLARLESAGLGEMRQDGYGAIYICDPFHLEVEPV